MATQYRGTMRYNLANLGNGINVFYAQNTSPLPPSDNEILNEFETWMEQIYGPLLPFMDTNIVPITLLVQEIDTLGAIIRDVGSRVPSVAGAVAGDALALTTAGTGSARTNVPKVRGGKRFPGLSEIAQADGLLFNNVLAALAAAVGEWLAGPGGILIGTWVAGVISEKVQDFVAFNNSGRATNVPGTQVTRKPLRGS